MTDESATLRDYRCLVCGEVFSREDSTAAAPVTCPACGSNNTWEHWESRVRNAANTPDGRYEELRDRPG